MSQLTEISPIVADVHLHTNASHGKADVKSMFAACRERGLKIIGFSEHSPRPQGYNYADDYQAKLQEAFPAYVRDVLEVQAEWQNEGIRVLLGLEVDYIPGEEKYAAALCEAYPYDYIIGGLHFQGPWGFDGPQDAWELLNQEQRFAVFARYYQDLACMCATGLFNVAAHPDLIKMHVISDFHEWLKCPESLQLVSTALEAMYRQGMGMEVSSAGLRKACREIYPGPVIMQLASDIGAMISFGSDAHCTDTPAYAFAELARYAAGFGFRESVVFIKRQPHFLPFAIPPVLR